MAEFVCYSRNLLTSYFAFQSPMMKRTSSWVLVLEGLVGLYSTIQLQLLQHYSWGIDLDYYNIEHLALKVNRGHSIVLRLHLSTAFQALLLTMRATPFLLRDSCPQ